MNKTRESLRERLIAQSQAEQKAMSSFATAHNRGGSDGIKVSFEPLITIEDESNFKDTGISRDMWLTEQINEYLKNYVKVNQLMEDPRMTEEIKDVIYTNWTLKFKPKFESFPRTIRMDEMVSDLRREAFKVLRLDKEEEELNRKENEYLTVDVGKQGNAPSTYRPSDPTSWGNAMRDVEAKALQRAGEPTYLSTSANADDDTFFNPDDYASIAPPPGDDNTIADPEDFEDQPEDQSEDQPEDPIMTLNRLIELNKEANLNTNLWVLFTIKEKKKQPREIMHWSPDSDKWTVPPYASITNEERMNNRKLKLDDITVEGIAQMVGHILQIDKNPLLLSLSINKHVPGNKSGARVPEDQFFNIKALEYYANKLKLMSKDNAVKAYLEYISQTKTYELIIDYASRNTRLFDRVIALMRNSYESKTGVTVGGGIRSSGADNRLALAKKYYLDRNKLNMFNLLDLRYIRTKKPITKPCVVSNQFKKLILKQTENNEFDKTLYHQLNDTEKHLFATVARCLGIDMNELYNDDSLAQQWQVILGELEAGNDSRLLKKKARDMLFHLVRIGRLSQFDMRRLFNELDIS